MKPVLYMGMAGFNFYDAGRRGNAGCWTKDSGYWILDTSGMLSLRAT